MLPDCYPDADTEYEGNDILIRQIDKKKMPAGACANLCRATKGGLFWTYYPKEKKCSVKSSKSGIRKYPGAWSGNRECGHGKKHENQSFMVAAS